MQNVISTLALAVLLVGCHTQGTYIKEEEVQKIESTIKTAKDLQEQLGNPTVTVPISREKTMWVYDGMKSSVGATTFVPYLNYLIATTSQKCTHLTVLVDNTTGELSDWSYKKSKDLDHYMNTDDTCEDSKNTPEESK